MTDKIEVEKPARYHAIERTSPTGPGNKYVGTCWQCGKTGLTLADAQEPCENIAALTETESLLMAIEANPGAKAPWPDPAPEMLNDPIFEAIWQTIKTWDINVPTQYVGYCGATGNHVRAIFDAVLSTTALSELDRLRSSNEAMRKALEEIALHPVRNVVRGRPDHGLRGFRPCQEVAEEALSLQEEEAR